MADVDNSAWDASKAWANGAAADDPAAFYNGICAGKKAGDPATQAAHALPHHYHPGDAPNASGTANALSRLPQTQGLTNKAAAQDHLEAHMKVINPDYEPASKAVAAVTARAAVIRRAARAAADADDSVPGLVAALDATLDQAAALLAAGDEASIAQAAALITAAEAVADDLMDLLGIPDPDDPDAGQAASAPRPAATRARPAAARVRPANARQVAQMRADAMHGQRRGEFPAGAGRRTPAKANLRHEQTIFNGKPHEALHGYATVYDLEYEMWDMFGPYKEKVAPAPRFVSWSTKAVRPWPGPATALSPWLRTPGACTWTRRC